MVRGLRTNAFVGSQGDHKDHDGDDQENRDDQHDHDPDGRDHRETTKDHQDTTRIPPGHHQARNGVFRDMTTGGVQGQGASASPHIPGGFRSTAQTLGFRVSGFYLESGIFEGKLRPMSWNLHWIRRSWQRGPMVLCIDWTWVQHVCMYIHVCMYVCIYIYIYICTAPQQKACPGKPPVAGASHEHRAMS